MIEIIESIFSFYITSLLTPTLNRRVASRAFPSTLFPIISKDNAALTAVRAIFCFPLISALAASGGAKLPTAFAEENEIEDTSGLVEHNFPLLGPRLPSSHVVAGPASATSR